MRAAAVARRRPTAAAAAAAAAAVRRQRRGLARQSAPRVLQDLVDEVLGRRASIARSTSYQRDGLGGDGTPTSCSSST